MPRARWARSGIGGGWRGGEGDCLDERGLGEGAWDAEDFDNDSHECEDGQEAGEVHGEGFVTQMRFPVGDGTEQPQLP